MAQGRRPQHPQESIAPWITREFTQRGLIPPHATPEALARALEQERQITITFTLQPSDDAGVYGLLYRQEACAHTYVIVRRPVQNLALQRLTLFHELAHILFQHPLTEVSQIGALRGYMVTNEDDAVAEAFAVGAMQYSLLDADAPRPRPETDDHVPSSAFGRFLKRTESWS